MLNNVNYSLTIESGNGDYSVIPKDFDIISVSIISNEYGYDSHIKILGLENGKTSLTIKDNLTGQNAKLNITVVDAHLPVFIGDVNGEAKIENPDLKKMIEKDILNNSIIQNRNILLLQKNEGRSFFLFNSIDDANKSRVKNIGTYEFVTKENEFYLVLKYIQGDNQIKEQELLLSTKENGIKIISSFFGISQIKTRELSDTNPSLDVSDLPPSFLYMSQNLTSIYKTNHPTLTNAVLDVKGAVLSPYAVNPEVEYN